MSANLVAQTVKSLLAMWETWVWSLVWEDPLEKEVATHSSILAWEIPWTEEPGGLQSTGFQGVKHDWVTSLSFSSGCRTGKVKFSFQSQRKAVPKNVQTMGQLHSFHMPGKQCSKFLKLGFHSMWTKNFQMFKLDLEKAEEPEIQLPTSVGSQKKQENLRKTSTSTSLTTLKHLTVWITRNCGKFFNIWEYQTTLPASWEICVQVKKPQLELGMEQLTGSKFGKEYVKAVYCHPAYLTYMQSTSCKMLG